MKKAILITTFFSLLITPTFSQIGRPFNSDPTKRITYRNPFTLEKSKEYKGLFNYSESEDKLLAPNFLSKNLIARQNQIKIHKNTRSQGEMPCLIPDGYFTMRTITPDSSKRYTLLIKEL